VPQSRYTLTLTTTVSVRSRSSRASAGSPAGRHKLGTHQSAADPKVYPERHPYLHSVCLSEENRTAGRMTPVAQATHIGFGGCRAVLSGPVPGTYKAS
jgi:hypothetical protein